MFVGVEESAGYMTPLLRKLAAQHDVKPGLAEGHRRRWARPSGSLADGAFQEVVRSGS